MISGSPSRIRAQFASRPTCRRCALTYCHQWPATDGADRFFLFITRFQIVPEERAMLAKFGKPYADYRQRVRRWLRGTMSWKNTGDRPPANWHNDCRQRRRERQYPVCPIGHSTDARFRPNTDHAWSCLYGTRNGRRSCGSTRRLVRTAAPTLAGKSGPQGSICIVRRVSGTVRCLTCARAARTAATRQNRRRTALEVATLVPT